MDQKEVEIRINDGKIKGLLNTTPEINFYSFQAIPYAKPPVGKLRFKPPVPPEPWQGVLDATNEAPECYGRIFGTNTYSGTDDCLYLNVYTPRLNASKLKVMFWIHGGGFTSGSGSRKVYGPDYLLQEDVILVTINYRTGVLGFLSLEDPELNVPGNAGLKDMVLALKWVKNNIKFFGGDPNNVTIFGESAGGAAVHYLILSPLAKGLFHKAIAQSGCALNAWARGSKPAFQLSRALGFESLSEKAILDHLQNLSVEQLYEGTLKIPDTFFIGDIRPFGPIVERKSKNSFISEEPINIIKSGNYNKVPMMFGCTNREGMLIYATMSKQHILTDPTLLPFNFNISKRSELYSLLTKTIRKFYFKTENFDSQLLKNHLDDVFKLYSHNYFTVDIYKSVQMHLKNSKMPIYFYRFSLDTDQNMIKQLFGITEPGACHADDICYLFKNEFSGDLINGSEEYLGVKRMVKLWTNFAKYGDPTPDSKKDKMLKKWLRVKGDKFRFLEIDKELKMSEDLDSEAIKFWTELSQFSTLNKL